MQIDLTGKTALVTGGNIGIGRSAALALAEAGADVAITYLSHDGEDTRDTITQLGRKAITARLDATDSAQTNQRVGALAAQLGGHIDILFNNAGGLVGRAPIADMDDDLFQRVFEVNVTSAFYVTRATLPFMRNGWGRVIFNGSIAGHHGGGNGAVAYAAAKGAIHTLTRGLAKEIAPRGITVNAVAPGFITDTPFHATFTPPAGQEAQIANAALKRAGMPEDVAGAILFLASDLAAFITGEVVEINGGSYFA